jgi:hypothetical protein
MDGTEYITLKEAGEISGYSPDYVGQLIRRGKLEGKQVYANVAWVTTKDALRGYLAEKGKSEKFDDDRPVSVASSEKSVNHIDGGPATNRSATDASESEHSYLLVQEKWERFFRVVSLCIIVCSVLFLILLFHILSTLLDDRLERRAFERVSTSASTLNL